MMHTTSGVTSCPSIESLDDFISGRLDGSSSTNIDLHRLRCQACQERISEIEADEEALRQILKAGLGPQQDQSARFPVITGYTIERELHRGGQGVVYAAVQESTRRPVAVKLLLHGRYASTREWRRFEREIEAVASLDHPAIVPAFDSGRTSDGLPYLIMQFIDGVAIDTFIDATLPTLAARVQMIAEIASAAHAAHQRGIMHRDLKPSNVLIDAHGQPHLLDFGLARSVDPAGASADDVSIDGAFSGTLQYAAPEQLAGDSHRVDIRCDVHALGALLYRVVTGVLPFQDRSPAALLRAISETDPAPPHTVANVDADLSAIVMKALRKEPADRYQSAIDLAADLNRWLHHQPVTARVPTAGYILRKFMQRNRALTVTIAVAGVLLAGSMVAIGVSWWRTSQAEHAASQQLQQSQRQ
ncbi:MAG: serine/threonine-protein kinase [Phycisphaerales bacterium]